MTRYKKAFFDMIEYNQSLFNEFKAIHDSFAIEQGSWREKFDEEGTKILRVIRRYENALCSKSENTGYSKYSANLSDKFWEEVRGYLPLIDQVRMV